MSNRADQRVVDLGYDIMRDSKRRTLYYDEKTKKGYQINTNDIKWIRLYKLRFFIALVIYFSLFMLFRNMPILNRVILCLVAGVIAYFGITLLFEKVFLEKKVPFKISQTDFDQRFEYEVLKQKRTLNRFHLAFILVYGALAILELISVNTSPFITFGIGAIVIALSMIYLQKLLAIREQIKIAKNKAA